MQIKIFGCRIYISLLFLTMLTLVLLLDKTGLMLFGILAVIIHECGHLLMMILTHNTPDEIVLQPAGIMIKSGAMFCGNTKKLMIASAGIVANIVAAAVAIIIYLWLNSEMALYFAAANVAVMLFNMLIISGLDGYDILLLSLERHIEYHNAAKICKIVSYITVSLLVCVVILMMIFFGGSLSLLICAVYLIILALMNIRC